jgi:transposase
VGEDGFALLDALEASEVPAGVRELASVAALRHTWQRHYERLPEASPEEPAPARRVRFKENRDLPRAAEGIESPYDVGRALPPQTRHLLDRLYGAGQRNL